MKKKRTPSPPAVSVILCTYNRAALLPRAIRSVLGQRFGGWELIIIDDGSTDHTSDVVRHFVGTDARIRYHYQPNRGLAMARNAGLARARGAFVTFIDSDDAYRRDHLEHRVRYMRRHPSVGMVHGGAALIGPKRKQFVLDMERPDRTIHLSQCHIGGTYFIRRSVLRRVGRFRAIPFGEDFDFFARVERRTVIRKVRTMSYRYYLNSDERLCDIFTARIKRR